VQQVIEPIGHARDAIQQAHQELTPDDGGELHRALTLVSEPVEARHDDALDRVRHIDFRHRAGEDQLVVLQAQHAEVEQRLGDLLDEQRDALRLLEQRGLQLAGQLRVPEQRAGERQRIAVRQAREEKLRVANGGV
jgi:hypothetical protein